MSRRQPGQSIVLLALFMVVLVAFVGLSVDVGNAYGQQRRMQNAANAGALGGMNAWIAGQSNGSTYTNNQVWTNVKSALAANRVAVDVANGAYTYKAEYITEGTSGAVLLGQWPGSTTAIYNPTGQPPSNVDRIRVTVTNRVDTFFARAVHRDTLTVNANGDACFGQYGLGTYPIGIPSNLRRQVIRKPPPPVKPPEDYHRVFELNDLAPVGTVGENDTLGAELAESDPRWERWDRTPTPNMEGLIIYLPVENWNTSDVNMPGTHVAWLDWTPSGGGANDLRDALTEPGTYSNGFQEDTPPNPPGTANTAPLGQLTTGDWIDGQTGEMTTLTAQLEDLLFKKVQLPLYDVGAKDGGNTAFRFEQMGAFKIVGYKFTGNNANPAGINPPADLMEASDKYLLLQYLEDSSEGLANSCETYP